MELKEQTNYQLYRITRQSPVSVSTNLIVNAKQELSKRGLTEVDLDVLMVRYEFEYPSVVKRQKEKHSKLMGVILLALGTFLSLILYILPIAIFIFLAGAYYIIDSSLIKTKKWTVIGGPIFLILLFYSVLLPYL